MPKTPLIPQVLFLPLDDRPVTRDAVLDLAAAAGIPVRTPDRSLLGNRDRAADVHAVWSWMHSQMDKGARPAACVAAAEMLCFGGLVASRTSPRHWRNLLPWLDQTYALAARVPTYLSAVIPRTPVSSGCKEDASYWEAHGEALRAYSLAADHFAWMGDAGAGRQVAAALEAIPAGVIEAVLQHRRRHLLLNAELIAAAARQNVRALVIGQDDTTAGGLSRLDREALERLAKVLDARTVTLTAGADELGALLFARWLNEAAGLTPAVRVVYTYPHAMDRVPAYESTPLAETVREHIEAAGCRVAAAGEEILLWVHNFEEEQQREAREQPGPEVPAERISTLLAEARAATGRDGVAALADVRFANGADATLVERLLGEPHFARIAAYAGWNTASNSLGSAVAQAVTVLHLRRFTVPGDDGAAWRMLVTRLLDDWGYQAVVRPRLAELVHEQDGDVRALGALTREAEEASLSLFREKVLPPLEQSLGMTVPLRRVSFPWGRLFEAAFAFEPPPRGGRDPVVVADYDPGWPALFAEEQVRIFEALGRTAAVEHVGSTAVPGLAAKPIVDILVGIPPADDLDRCVGALVALGYDYMPEYEMSLPNRRYFRKSDAQGRRTHHVHAVPLGGPFWHRHIAFRDYLRRHPEAAGEYQNLKRRLATEAETHPEYTFAKTEFIRRIERAAGVGQA